jgi:peptide-methionine (S)-S-oxide reductase
VLATAVGYMGGTAANPSYEQVCSGRTGHAETVQVEFDPDVVSYRDLVDRFWQIHDPTQLNRQGPDFGTQYRSAIFVDDDEQAREARDSQQEAQRLFSRPIVTQIVPDGRFWRGEDYHQQYLEKRGLATCRIPGMATL